MENIEIPVLATSQCFCENPMSSCLRKHIVNNKALYRLLLSFQGSFWPDGGGGSEAVAPLSVHSFELGAVKIALENDPQV